MLNCLANVGQVPLLAEQDDHDRCSDNAHANTEEGETSGQTVKSVVLKIDLRKCSEKGYRCVSLKL